MVRNTGKHAAGIIITDQPLDEFVPLTSPGRRRHRAIRHERRRQTRPAQDGLPRPEDAHRHLRRRRERPPHRQARSSISKPFRPRRPQDLRRCSTPARPSASSSSNPAACRARRNRSASPTSTTSTPSPPSTARARWRSSPTTPAARRTPPSIVYPHPLLEPVLKETYGIIVYQEQVMECARVIAGYTLGGADMLRRAMGKKDAEAMAKERVKFVEGAGARATTSTRQARPTRSSTCSTSSPATASTSPTPPPTPSSPTTPRI